ncbi:PAS domain S-box protein [Chloroflexia bacterium SDU3-3]|nr:PAS domain S-box protein [Chloroflexia bacterium SDU3-3]
MSTYLSPNTYDPPAHISAALRQICERTARIADRALGGAACSIFFTNSDTLLDYPVQGQPLLPSEQAFVGWICRQAARSHSPLLLDGTGQDPLLAVYPEPLPALPRSIAALALRTVDQPTIGAIAVCSAQPRTWADGDLALLDDLAAALVSEITLYHQSRAYSMLADHIQRSEHFLQLALDAITDEVIILNEQGVIIAMNTAAQASWRSMAPQVIDVGLGRSYFSLWAGAPPEYATAAMAIATGIHSILAGEERFFTHEYAYPYAGEMRWYSARISAFTDADRRRVVIAHQDITARKRAEAKLRESEALYRTVINSLHEGILVHDNLGEILTCNQSTERILGIPQEQLLGKNSLKHTWAMYDVDERPFPMEDRPALVALTTGRACTDVVMGLAPPGRDRIWILMNAYPLFRPGDPAPYGVVASFSDITERRRTEAELQQLSLVASKAESGILICDNLGAVEWCNEAFYRLTGYTLDDIRGRRPIELLHGADSDAQTGPHMIAALRAGSPVLEEILLYRRDGTPFWAMVNITPIFDSRGVLTKFIVIQNDITYRKELEQMKNDFVALVSHELRTPLTSIRGALGLLVGGLAGELPPQAQAMIDIATNNSDRLVRLINDILDIEKIASGRMSFAIQPLPILPLIRQTIDANQPYTQQYGTWVELEGDLDEDALVYIDPDRIIQVFTNLISNAAKFSPRGLPITITLSRHDSTMRVAVADSGPGIPAHFRSSIFQRFAQADSSSTRQKGGSGLGLSISKAIVEQLGGSIGFESVPDVGTVFFVDLRMQPADPAAARQRLPARLLVCDPSPTLAQPGAAALPGSYHIDHVRTIGEARLLQARYLYDAVRLKIDVDTDEGRAWMSELRDSQRTRHMPIIMDAPYAAAPDATALAFDPSTLLQAIAQPAQQNDAEQPWILHVEDDPDIRQIVDVLFQDVAQVRTATSVSEACGLLLRYRFDLVLLDLSLPDGSGERVLRFIHELQLTPVPVVVFAAGDSDELLDPSYAVAAFLVKSRITNEALRDTIRQVMQFQR